MPYVCHHNLAHVVAYYTQHLSLLQQHSLPAVRHVLRKKIPSLGQFSQGLPCTYLAPHEPESVDTVVGLVLMYTVKQTSTKKFVYYHT